MNTAKHTPGPWSLCNWMVGNNTPTGEVTICGLEGDEHICTMDGNEDNQANATLIAAAPAMYEALRVLTSEINLSTLNVRKDFSLMNAHACAVKAILQAEGQLL